MIDTLTNLYYKQNYPLFTRPYDLNVFGIRVSGPSDSWDDTLGCFYSDGQRWHLHRWTGTTTPGAYYLQHPMNSNGCLVVAPTFHRSLWKLGTHKGYPALQQVGTLTYWRDQNLDSVVDETKWITGTSNGVNGHHGYGSKTVGKNSAGCQVWRYKEHLSEMLDLVRKQNSSGLGDRVSYALFDTRKTPEAQPMALQDAISSVTTYE